MNLAIMGNGRSYIDEQLSLYTKAGNEPIDVGLVQAYGPSWSPDGDQVAFLGSKEEGSPLTYSDLGLYIMNAEGKDVWLVLEGFHDASGVAWSPQGRWLAFPAAFGEREEERYGLWLFDMELGQARQIAEGSFGSVRWSEDGERIAVVQFLGPPLESEDRVAIVEVGPLLGD
jgi:Tol biopolymer transport system component